VLVLLAAAAVVIGAGALFVARRPAPSIRIFEAPAPSELVVQVDGAVRGPGLYRLPPGARAADAIAAAGGASADADLSLLNQAKRLRDGERLSVPRRTVPSAPPSSGDRDPIDLNTAGVDTLDRLPGIGPVLARRIVTHRERHGPFHRLEDLLQIDGIGPRLLDRIRPLVVIR
jgi:competence protein ComEA